jgi:hypothetical protein
MEVREMKNQKVTLARSIYTSRNGLNDIRVEQHYPMNGGPSCWGSRDKTGLGGYWHAIAIYAETGEILREYELPSAESMDAVGIMIVQASMAHL